jgi:carboxypeptidase family protein
MLFALLVFLAAAPVSGRIVDAESNKPIAGAHVMLIPVEQTLPTGAAGPLQAVTDANGQFVFEAVGPGQYRIDAQMPGFVPFAAASPTVDTTAGQAIAGIELFLKRGGAITGRIVDAGGQPLPWITVSALKYAADSPEGRVMPMTAQMAQTNDLGEFRLAGLAEGDYVVIAAPPPQRPFAQSQSTPAGVALSPTYYPGTTDRNAAQIVTVASAQTVSDLQFSLVSTPAYEVSGVVVDEAGSPVRAAMVTLMMDSHSGGIGMPAMGQSDENGMFRVGGVVPGTYRLMASMPMMWSAQSGASAAAGGFVAVTGGVYIGGAGAGGPGVPPPPGGVVGTPTEVTVENADVSGVKIVLTTQK